MSIYGIPENEINTILNRHEFGSYFPATIATVEGDTIGVNFKRPAGSVYKMLTDKWANAQMRVRNGALSGAVMHIKETSEFDNAKDKLFMIKVDAALFDLSNLQLPTVQSILLPNGNTSYKVIPGSSIILEWDYSKLPAHYFEKEYIVNVSMPAANCGHTGLPRGLTNTFINCVVTNHELPTNCKFETRSGGKGCNKHYKRMNDLEYWEVSKADNYTAPSGDPLNIDVFRAEKQPTNKEAIPDTPISKRRSLLAEEARLLAEKNGNETYEVLDITYNNDKYVGGV